MIRTKIVTDLESCGALWNSLVAPRHISDLWEFRLCFHRHFKNWPFFLVVEDEAGLLAMLPLCRLDKEELLVFFPGETWQGRTWLERTPIYCRDPEALPEVLSLCPAATYLRYMESHEPDRPAELEIDEIGYLLHPSKLLFSKEEYHKRFTWKKLKAINKEIASILAPGASWHLNRPQDFDTMVRMNKSRFDERSYFHDPRFMEAFREALHWLNRKGRLRMVSLEIRGQIAAVDLGSLWGRNYVVFLGGTHPDFPGVAKAMNMQHIDFAFEEGLCRVDFLCGDFYWKKLWHLDPEPLYKYVSPALRWEHQPREGLSEPLDFILPSADLGVAAH